MTFLGQTGTPSEGFEPTFTGENEERDKNFRYLQGCMVIARRADFRHPGAAVQQFSSGDHRAADRAAEFHRRRRRHVAGRFPVQPGIVHRAGQLDRIVVNDAIVVVDFINQSRLAGLPLERPCWKPAGTASAP